MLKRILKSAIAKNAGWIMGGRIAQMVLSLFVGLLTARYLGPSNFGLINYASAYTAFFMAFCTLGINSILVKEFVDHPGQEGEIIGSSLLLKGISSLLSAGMIICLVSIVDAGEKTTVWVTSICSIGVVFHIFETFNYWFQSRLQSKVTAMIALVGYGATCVYRIVLLALGKDVIWFAFATTVDYICIGILLLVCYFRQGGGRLTVSKATCKRLISQSYHFILPSLMVAIYGYTDRFMLKQMMTEADVGFYATATAVCSMWCFVLTAIIDSMYPSIMGAHKTDYALFEKRNRQLYAMVFYISVSVSVVFCVGAKWIIEILYGAEYLPAVNPLRMITWYTAFSYLGVARNAWLVCEQKQKYLKYIYISAALCNVALNLAFIPLWGPTGAALASLITQIITCMIMPVFIKELKQNTKLMLEGMFFVKIR